MEDNIKALQQTTQKFLDTILKSVNNTPKYVVSQSPLLLLFPSSFLLSYYYYYNSYYYYYYSIESSAFFAEYYGRSWIETSRLRRIVTAQSHVSSISIYIYSTIHLIIKRTILRLTYFTPLCFPLSILQNLYWFVCSALQ